MATRLRHAAMVMLFLAVLGRSPLRAQMPQQPLASYQGQTVSSVEIAGRPDVNREALQPLIAQKPGSPFSQQDVTRTIAALESQGRFRNVDLEVSPEANGLRVYFVVQPALYPGTIDFPGSGRFPYSRLLQTVNVPNQEPYAASRISEATTALVNFFRRSGYFLATVQPEIRPNYSVGLVNLVFHVNLNRRAKFGEVRLLGVSPEEDRILQASLRSIRARLKGAAIRHGKTFKQKTLRNATAFLQQKLVDLNYVASDVRLQGADYNAETNLADVDFQVKTGPLLIIRVVGASISARTARRVIPIFQDNAVDDGLIRDGEHGLVSYYQSKGFFDAKVTTEVVPTDRGMNITYHVERGSRHKVTKVAFSGNQHFTSKKLASVATVHKARLPFLTHGEFSDEEVRSSVTDISNLYQDDGYSQVSVTPVLRRSPNLEITFKIVEGPQDKVGTLRLEGNNQVPLSQLAPHGLRLAPGKPYSQHLLTQDRSHIAARYLDLGFLNASVRWTAKPEKGNPHLVDVTYQIDEGPQVRADRLITVGARHTRAEIINRAANLPVDKPVSDRRMLAAESRLYDLGVFDSASIGPRRAISNQTDTDIIIRVHESKRNTITYGFGFEVVNRGGNVPGGTVALPGLPPVGLPSGFQTSQKTFWGPRGSVQYTRENLWGRAESFTIGALGARLDQRAQASYSDPSFFKGAWASTTTVSAERNSENPLFTARLGEAGFQLQKALDPKKTMSVFLRYDFRRTDLTNLLIPDLVLPQDRNVRLSTVSGSFARDTRDNPLDAHRGFYQSFDLGITPSALGSSANFGRLMLQNAYYKKVFGDTVWANSIRIGLEQPFLSSHIPLSEEFFSGGGSTLRGFPLNGAGPQRDVTVCSNPASPSTCSQIRVPVGGPQLLILNSELRYPLSIIMKNLGGTVFYDGGNVFSHVSFASLVNEYSNTVGVGLRYQTPVGPIRIDIGRNLNPIPGLKATQVFVTLGQAF